MTHPEPDDQDSRAPGERDVLSDDVTFLEGPTIGERVMRRISSENPFYLLSAAFVIHSTGLSILSEAQLDLKALLSIVTGYLILISALGIIIVRLWKVWDDARSIFLIPVLLMFELALAFDKPISTGASWGIAGLATVALGSLALSEFILRLARIRLPALYRIPFYLQLSLLLLATLIPHAVEHAESKTLVRWGIYGVSGLAGLSMLTLIPAVRTGRNSVEFSGCPWKWPYHPWSLFVIVWVCLGFRLYLLTISFDPAYELTAAEAYGAHQTIFTGMLLVPMLLGIGWLMLEAALVHRSKFAHMLALGIPFACIVLSVRPWSPNSAVAAFMDDYTQVLGSPVWVAMWCCLFFTSVAWMRGLPFARRCFVFSLLMFSRIGPETQNVLTLESVNLYWIGAACLVLFSEGYKRRASRFVVEAVAWGILSGGQLGYLSGWGTSSLELQVHLVMLTILIVGGLLKDETLDLWKTLLCLYLIIGTLRTSILCFFGVYEFPMVTLLLSALCLFSLLTAKLLDESFFRELAILIGIGGYIAAYWEGGRYGMENLQWHGLWQFLVGVVLLHCGVLISAYKGGAFRRRQHHQSEIGEGQRA